MRIRWTPAAAGDLEEIDQYLKDRHPAYRNPTILELYDSIRSLREFPNRGRLGREEGTRELVLPPLPYVVVYRVREDAVEVLRIVHSARMA
jgi:toxin ParE1/3/4